MHTVPAAHPPATSAPTTADYVNPVIKATKDVFEMMLDCHPRRTALTLRGGSGLHHHVSGIIGMTGPVVGTIVLCLPKEAALQIPARMIGSEATEINDEVRDAVGELTNMIAGAAKAQLEHLKLSLSLPNVICGEDHLVYYPSDVKPFCIVFESELGPFLIEVAFTNRSA